MTSAAALVVAFPFFRRLRQTGSRTRLGLATVGAVAAAAIIATGLYRLWGNPAGLAVNAPSIDMAAAAAHPGAAAGNAGAAPNRIGGSCHAQTCGTPQRQGRHECGLAVARARVRIHGTRRGRQTSSGSRGRRPELRGREFRGAANSAAPAPAAPPVVSAEGNRLLAEAEKYRVARDYPHAVDAYKRLVRMHAMTADAWANYADAIASGNGGKLSGAPGDFLAEALRLDPDHPKALWLEASMLHEQHRYPEAVGVWQHLASILPAGSSDAKIIAANIDEAQRLSGGAAPPTAAQDAARPVQISGEVDIDPALRSKALPSSTLFVFAKAADSPGPPLAVVRASVDQWPVKFSLNDSQAMMPQRKLSDFQRVIVEARISQSGQPMGQRGDLQGSSGTLDPKSDKPIRVVIRDVIG